MKKTLVSIALAAVFGLAHAQSAPQAPMKFPQGGFSVETQAPNLGADQMFPETVQTGYRAPAGNNVGLRDIPGLDEIRADAIHRFARTVDPTDKDQMRLQAIRDLAKTFGVRHGLYARTNQINNLLRNDEMRPLLNRIFNFQNLMVDANIDSTDGISRVVMVMPPVILEGRNSISLSRPEMMRRIDHSLRIKRQARFVTVPPTWENYLIFHAQKPRLEIHESLVPRNDAEKAEWDDAVVEGWNQGLEHADAIFFENIARLKEDFEGMQRYQLLLVQNLVSKPFVASTNMGVTGDSSKLNINDEILMITAMPELNLDTESWRLHPSW